MHRISHGIIFQEIIKQHIGVNSDPHQPNQIPLLLLTLGVGVFMGRVALADEYPSLT